MAKLPSFSGVTQPQDDLLHKGFTSHFGLKLIDKSSQGVISKASVNAVKTEGSSSIVTKAHYEQSNDSGLLLKFDLGAEQRLRAAFEYTPPDNTKVKLSSQVTGALGNTDSLEASLTTDFTTDQLRASFGVTAGPKFKLTGLFGQQQVGAGVNLEFDAGTCRFSSYNWLVYWSQPSTRLVLKHLGSNASVYTLGLLKLSYYASLSKHTNIAAELSMGLNDHTSHVEVGVEHGFSSDLTGKVRVNEKGLVATSVSHRLNEHALLTTSSALNLPRRLLDLGLRLTLSS